jgi:hypothetical protein
VLDPLPRDDDHKRTAGMLPSLRCRAQRMPGLSSRQRATVWVVNSTGPNSADGKHHLPVAAGVRLWFVYSDFDNTVYLMADIAPTNGKHGMSIGDPGNGYSIAFPGVAVEKGPGRLKWGSTF